MKRIRLWILTTQTVARMAAAILAFAAVWLAGCTGRGVETGGSETSPAVVQSTIGAVEANGMVRARQSAQLAWQMTGIVGQVQGKVGDRVTARQELSALDPQSLPQIAILAQANWVEARQALEELQNSQKQQARARLAVEQSEQALDEMLYPEMAQAQAQEAIAAAEKALEAAELQVYILTKPASQLVVEQARADLLLAQNKLDSSRKQLEKLQKQLKKLAQLPPAFRASFRGPLRKGIDGMEMVVNRNERAVEDATEKLEKLQAPPDPTDLAVAQANLTLAQAQLAEAQEEFERLREGFSAAEIAVAEAQLGDAERQWERLKNGPDPDELAAAEARVAAAEAAIAQTRLVAPFDGVITRVGYQVGDRVNPGDVAFRLDDLSRLFVDAQVSEMDINLVFPGQAARLTFDGVRQQEYHGVVTEVAPVGTALQGVVTFTVKVEIADADGAVRPGMTSLVEILTGDAED